MTPVVVPEQMDGVQRALYDTILGGPRSTGPQSQPLTESDGSLVGPFNSMLLAPPAGTAVQGLGAALRFESTLTDRQREFAVLLVAHRCQSDFERIAHERIARNVTDESYATAVAALGAPMVYELTTIVGHYSLLALHLRMFNGESGPGAPRP